MKTTIRRKVAIGAAGLTVLAGAGGAWAVTSSDDDPQKERQAFLNDAAKRLNVSPDKLDEALKGALKDRIDEAQKKGRLTDEQANELKQRIDRNGVPLPGAPGLGHGFRGGPPYAKGGLFVGAIDAAASYLGLDRKQLFDQFQDGKSLADIAKDRNKSVDGLKDAIQDAARKKLDEAVKDNRLTDRQRDRILEELDRRIDELVEHDGPVRPFRGHHERRALIP